VLGCLRCPRCKRADQHRRPCVSPTPSACSCSSGPSRVQSAPFCLLFLHVLQRAIHRGAGVTAAASQQLLQRHDGPSASLLQQGKEGCISTFQNSFRGEVISVLLVNSITVSKLYFDFKIEKWKGYDLFKIKTFDFLAYSRALRCLNVSGVFTIYFHDTFSSNHPLL
jgi:hypothetical protein